MSGKAGLRSITGEAGLVGSDQVRRRVCVTMIDPADRGGVYTMAAELYGLLERWGWDPSLLYLSGRQEDRLWPRSLLRRGRLWDTRQKVNRGLKGMAVGHVLAHFGSLAYFWPYPVVRRYLRPFDLHVVVGAAMTGITIAWASRPYLCWLTTLYEDELISKAELGDPWAQKVLSSATFRLYRMQERYVLRHAHLVATISEYTADRVRQVYPDVADRLVVVPVPVDVKTFCPADGPTTPGEGPSRSVIWVGRPEDPRKNTKLLLEAFQRVLKSVPDARLTIVGARSTGLSLQAYQLGLNGSIEFQPHAKGPSELAALYRRAHVLVLSSRQEGLGIVVQEAMAAGLPVVSTRCGGPEGVVRSGETGFLVPSGDADALAEAVVELLKDPAKAREMGKRARCYAVADFSREAVEALLRQAFERVLAGAVG